MGESFQILRPSSIRLFETALLLVSGGRDQAPGLCEYWPWMPIYWMEW